MANLDGPWKDIIEHLFPQMMALLFPEIAEKIDWSFEPQFKDNELPKLDRPFGASGKGRRHLDRLVLVQLLDGSKRYLLIHIEIQNQYDKTFTARMFCYFYRLHDRSDYPVTSLAIIGDLSPNWRPGCYEEADLGHRLVFEFRTAKLLDFEDKIDELLAGTNPFGLAIVAHLKTMRTRRDPQDRAHWKRQLFRLAIMKGLDRPDLANLIRFIDWMMGLSAKLDKQVEQALNLDLKEANMEFRGGIHGTIHILAKEEGLKEGKEEGLKEGKEEGLKEGLTTGRMQERAEILVKLLEVKYGEVPSSFLEKVKNASFETLAQWSTNLILKNSLEETFT